MPRPVDDDATIVLKKPGRLGGGQWRGLLWVFAGPAMLLVLAGGWMLWPAPRPPPPAVAPQAIAPQAIGPETITPAPAAAPPVAPEPPKFAIEPATEPDILNHVATATDPEPMIFRFEANPRVLVLDFASLTDQGHMLNRIAALTEKAGLPHDRVLNDAELDAAVRAGGDTVETFYYGHDYGAPALPRFFALADRDEIRLLDGEETLRRLIRQDGWFEPDANAAIISIPQIGADDQVTRSARATILHHELSHGEYFTNPAYVAFVHHFWTQILTAAERDRIRRHLHSLGYDPALEEVMENEAQAYLMFTDSPRFFAPDMIGMSRGRLAELRAGFYRTMPAGWLRDSLGQTLNAGKQAKP